MWVGRRKSGSAPGKARPLRSDGHRSHGKTPHALLSATSVAPIDTQGRSLMFTLSDSPARHFAARPSRRRWWARLTRYRRQKLRGRRTTCICRSENLFPSFLRAVTCAFHTCRENRLQRPWVAAGVTIRILPLNRLPLCSSRMPPAPPHRPRSSTPTTCRLGEQRCVRIGLPFCRCTPRTSPLPPPLPLPHASNIASCPRVGFFKLVIATLPVKLALAFALTTDQAWPCDVGIC